MSAAGGQPEWIEHVLVLRETVARIDERIDALTQRTDARFAALELRVDRLENEVATLGKTLYAAHAAQVAGLLGVIATLLATQ